MKLTFSVVFGFYEFKAVAAKNFFCCYRSGISVIAADLTVVLIFTHHHGQCHKVLGTPLALFTAPSSPKRGGRAHLNPHGQDRHGPHWGAVAAGPTAVRRRGAPGAYRAALLW